MEPSNSLRPHVVFRAAKSAEEGTAAMGLKPTVSVVVPVFNGATFVEESLDSILGQTYAPREVIVMDDASTDSTPEIVASYGNAVRYVRQPANRGQFGNVNDGLALATGDMVGVFHADDVYLPELLEREVAWLDAHPQAGAVMCSDIFIDVAGRELGRLELPPQVKGEQPLPYETVLNALLTYSNTFLRCPTALVRLQVYEDVGRYRDDVYKNTSDVDMWLRIARRYEIGILEDHLVLYRRGHGSSSERYHRIRTDPFRFFEIMDAELEAGGRGVAREDALRAYEAHRAVDAVLRAVSHYILGDIGAARVVLHEVRLATLAASPRVQRARMLVLTLGLRALVRLPRIAALGRLFERRWYPDAVGGS
jgi:glycosyltransferase involved in cell wall biosynthesis